MTGLGVASPIGIGVGQFWKAALAGQSGVSALSAFDGLPMDARSVTDEIIAMEGK